jgi:hypothetical protein
MPTPTDSTQPTPTPSSSSSSARTPTHVLGYSSVARDRTRERPILVASQLPRTATGVVIFNGVSDSRMCHAEVMDGVARCDVPSRVRPGRYRVTAHYCGSSTYDGSRSTFWLTVPRR